MCVASGRYSLSGPQPNYEGAQAQQHVLQDLHVGYGSRSFITRAGGHKFIVAGARPFSRVTLLIE